MSTSAANNSADSVTPILVVGFMRSGTKWLSNILCNHPDISGVQSVRARGILETNMFHRMQGKFDLRSSDDYIGFIELWKQTEFFQETGMDAGYFYSLNPRPLSFVALFQETMERYATRKGSRYWLQKCDPDRALRVLPELRDVKVVTIHRDIVSVVQSLRNITRNRDHEFSMVKAIPGIARSERLLARVERRYDGLRIDYEKLKEDPSGTVRMICDRLGVEFIESMLTVPYQSNTSFADTRPEPLSVGYRGLLRVTRSVSTTLPLWVLDRILGIQRRTPPPITFVAGTFGNLKDRLEDRQDYR